MILHILLLVVGVVAGYLFNDKITLLLIKIHNYIRPPF